MASAQPKTLTPLLILRILEEYSDEKHPLTREEIERLLDEKYGITMERKAFFRHMKNLGARDENGTPMKYAVADICRVTIKSDDPDKKPCAGFYLTDRAFNDAELRIIIDALAGNRYLSQWETEYLIGQVVKLAGPTFRKKLRAYSFITHERKTENEELMFNLQTIDEAIDKHKKIRITRYHTRNDGKKEISEAPKENCTPIRCLVRDHHYYLVGVSSDTGTLQIVSYILSDIQNIVILDEKADDYRSLPEFKYGIEWKKFFREHPSLDYFRGRPELCTFLCYRWMADEIKSHFQMCVDPHDPKKSEELRINQLTKEQNEVISDTLVGAKKNWLIEVSVITDPREAVQFAWNHPLDVWLIGPEHAYESLRNRLQVQQERYRKIDENYKQK